MELLVSLIHSSIRNLILTNLSYKTTNILITEATWGQRSAAAVSYLCRLSKYSKDGKGK